MVTRVLTAVVLFALSQPVLAGPPKTGPNDQPAKRDPKHLQKRKQAKKAAPPRNLAVKAMKLVIKDAEFDEMPFEDFTEWLGRTTGANVVVRWKVLEKAGVERDYPIIIKRKNIKVSKLLKLVFAQLTEDLRSVELAAKADGNTLVISTRKDINTKLIVRTYDVQNLLIVAPDFATPSFIHVDERRSIVLGTGRSGSRGRGGKPADDPASRLIHAITTSIQPLSWKVNGGRGTIVHFKGRLVIRNNVQVHQQLAGALSERPEDRPSGGV